MKATTGIVILGLFIIAIGGVLMILWDYNADDVKGDCFDRYGNLINDLVCDVTEDMPIDYKLIIGFLFGLGFFIYILGFTLAIKQQELLRW